MEPLSLELFFLGFMGIMLLTTERHPMNKILSGFWLIAIPTFGILALTEANNIAIGLYIVFNTLYQFLHIEAQTNARKN